MWLHVKWPRSSASHADRSCHKLLPAGSPSAGPPVRTKSSGLIMMLSRRHTRALGGDASNLATCSAHLCRCPVAQGRVQRFSGKTAHGLPGQKGLSRGVLLPGSWVIVARGHYPTASGPYERQMHEPFATTALIHVCVERVFGHQKNTGGLLVSPVGSGRPAPQHN